MELILRKQFNIEVDRNFRHGFTVSEPGLYLIEIIARADSWWQNLRRLRFFFRDDDLAVKIDGHAFPKLDGRRGPFDGEAAWNGNKLKGLYKTVVFAVNLEAGEHNIEFLVDQKPYLRSVTVSRVEDPDRITYIPIANNPAEDGNRRPWLTIALVDLPLKRLVVKASAKKLPRDDDDLKLIIDGKIQKRDSGPHKNWYWCGWNDRGGKKEFRRKLNPGPGLHYVELWADRRPFVYSIAIYLKSQQKNKEIIQAPTTDNPMWTGNFQDDAEQMILARAIFAEARSLPKQGRIAVGWSIRNRVRDDRWKDNYHDVILQKKQYSAFNEKDPNRPYAENPFLDKTQAENWYECYDIAGQVIRGETGDPTGGANHYYSDYIDPPYWVKARNAEFKIKIGNTYFYDLRPAGWDGSINVLLIVFILLSCLLIAGLYVAVKQNNRRDNAHKALAGAWQEPAFKRFYINPKTEEIGGIYFNHDGDFLGTRAITNDGYPKSHLKRFSNFEMFGYYQYLHTRDEAWNIDPKDTAAAKDYYEDYIALMIMENEYSEPREVYRGDYHTSYWEWSAIDNKHVKVHYSCGTHCMYVYVINIETGEMEDGYHLYD